MVLHMNERTTDRPLRQCSVKIYQDQFDALDEEAYRSRQSFSQHLREVLDWYLEHEQQETRSKRTPDNVQ